MTSMFALGKVSSSDDYLIELHGFIRVYKDGRCVRFMPTETLPAGIDSSTGVRSKDVVISPETNLSVRLYIPKTTSPEKKLPVLIYYHGGGFVVGSSASPSYHPTLNLITAESDVIVVSVDYRLAPEYPVPVGYNDSWEAIKWVAAHGSGKGPEPWLNDYADFQRVFLAGDSAGGNIAHNMAIRVGLEPVEAIKMEGMILLNPYFGGNDPIGSELGKDKMAKVFTDEFWKLANPSGSGLDDPLFNPEMDPNVAGMGCSKLLVCVAEIDSLRDRGLYYKELIARSGWPGKLEFMETKGEDHVFFLSNTSSENACTLRNKVCAFINQIRSKA